MSASTITVSRVKQGSQEESVLRKACELAAIDRRPFSITQGYDRVSIGAYTEFMIQHAHAKDVMDGVHG